MFQKYQTGKVKSCAARDSDSRRTECTPRKKFTCGSEDHIIAKCPIRDIIKRRQLEWKGAFKNTQNMCKGLH